MADSDNSWWQYAAAGVGALGGLISGKQTAKDNMTRFDRQMEENQREREWNLAQWNRQNEYNTPLNQMKRLQDAGLNPNLVYGNGASTQAGPVPTPSTKAVPELDRGSPYAQAFAQIYDISMKEMQKDLVQTEILAKTQQIAESAARTAKTSGVDTQKAIADTHGRYVQTDKNLHELMMARRLQNNVVETAEGKLKNVQLKNKEQEIINSQLPEKHKAMLMDTYSRMSLAKSQMDVNQYESLLKKEVLELRKKGIEVSDSKIMRILSDLLPDKDDNFITRSAKSMWSAGMDWYNNNVNPKYKK